MQRIIASSWRSQQSIPIFLCTIKMELQDGIFAAQTKLVCAIYGKNCFILERVAVRLQYWSRYMLSTISGNDTNHINFVCRLLLLRLRLSIE